MTLSMGDGEVTFNPELPTEEMKKNDPLLYKLNKAFEDAVMKVIKEKMKERDRERQEDNH